MSNHLRGNLGIFRTLAFILLIVILIGLFLLVDSTDEKEEEQPIESSSGIDIIY
ncbi:hypothetical protein [Aquibacillus saliphilus]|uniref:hypothetical protein n=1 Tax=Aquibacillus saliphilus TaxID=1909422 RepID=UPI001CEFBD0A|nr:hypothetical protein [Aquibacillus saliphilus]